MVERNIYQQRSVINEIADVEGAPVTNNSEIQASVKIGHEIIRENEEAKITENFSKAQLELNRMQTQYEIDNESNPYGAADKLKAGRKQLFDQLGNDISPYYRGQWNEDTRQLELKHDLAFDGWAIQQTKKNTVSSINKSIKNNMAQAMTAGQNYGTGDTTDIEAAIDFRQSRDKLAGFGDKNLGKGTTDDLLDSYGPDYLKSFLSGVAETNPVKALKLLDDESVKAGFKNNPDQYLKMKDAIENRALNVQEITGQRQILETLRDENSALAASLEKPMSYAELQATLDASPNMSPYAKSFFMKANGYTKEDAKLNPSEKIQAKAALYQDLTDMVSPAVDATLPWNDKDATTKDGVTPKDVSDMQGKIYKAMNDGVLDEKEGSAYLAQLVVPLANAQEQNLKNFAKTNNVSADLGFKNLQTYFDQNIAIKGGEDDEDLGDLTKTTNAANKVRLYDIYMSSLTSQAQSYGVAVGDIPKLNDIQKQKIFTDAQSQAIKAFHVGNNPALSTLNDLPNQVFKNGQLIQGVAGPRDLKPDFAVTTNFDVYRGSDGLMYRQYTGSDGKPRYEKVGSLPKGAM